MTEMFKTPSEKSIFSAQRTHNLALGRELNQVGLNSPAFHECSLMKDPPHTMGMEIGVAALAHLLGLPGGCDHSRCVLLTPSIVLGGLRHNHKYTTHC